MEKFPVVAQGLHKRFGHTHAVNDLSLRIESGELFGFIGPDGAGKTTLIRLLNTLMRPDSGEARVLGFPLKKYRQIRSRVGYVPGHSALYEDLSVRENLRFYATVFGATIAENYSLIEEIYEPLRPFEDRPAGKLSGGMRQKLALSCALIHRPQLIFLDEPSTGVDPVSRAEFWETVGRLKAAGITLIVATPYMDEAERCDRMLLLQEGSALAIDSPEGLRQSYDRDLLAVFGPEKIGLLQSLRQYPGLEEAYAFGQSVHATFSGPADRAALLRFLKEKGHDSLRLEPARPTIEDVFIRMNRKHTNGNGVQH